jgi:hypothetical protein
VGAKFFHEDKRGGCVEETKLKGAFWDYANSLKRSKILSLLEHPSFQRDEF